MDVTYNNIDLKSSHLLLSTEIRDDASIVGSACKTTEA